MPPKSNLSTIIRGIQGTPLVITDQGEAKVFLSGATTSGLATEATLLAIYNNMVASQDIEILLVRDTGNNDLIVQQIREYDQGTGAWTTRYEKVDGTPYVAPELVGPLEYLDPSAVLNLLLAEALDQGLTLDAIQTEQLAQGLSLDSIVTNTTGLATQLTLNDLLTAFNAEDFATETTLALVNSNTILGNTTLNNLLTAFNAEDFASQTTLASVLTTLQAIDSTVATEVTLAALNAKLNTLGQKASAASAPVVLSTEQELILDAIKTAVESIDSDLGTGGLALETTQVAIQNLITSTNALLTTIDADTSNLDVLLSTRAADASVLATNALLTTIDGVLDAIKVDTGALVVDVAAIEVLITTTNSLLTTIDGVLDAIKLDTANLDVALSTVATEVTLAKLLGPIGTDGVAHGASQQGIRALGTTAGGNDEQILVTTDGEVIVDGIAELITASTPATRTHNTVTATGAGNVPAGSMCGSVINTGNNAGTWNGISLRPGVSIPWSPIGNRDTYGAIAYDATGTTFIIEYTT